MMFLVFSNYIIARVGLQNKLKKHTELLCRLDFFIVSEDTEEIADVILVFG